MGIRGILGGVVVLAALLLVATFVFGLGRRSRPKLALVLVLAVAGYVLWPSGSVPDGPSVAVVASADGGWDVTVAEVPTATDYRLVVDDGRAVSLAGPGTWNVVPPDPKNGEYRPGPVHEATLTALRDGQPVARSAVTFCAPVVLVSARGTWQTPGDTDFSQGIGSRGWGTWQALARSLGVQSDRPGAHPTVVDAIGVRYPATGIPLVDDDSYATSRNEGKKSLRTLLTQISGSCPDSRVVLLGYSQGADVVASVWQDDAPGEAQTTGVVLLADPHFNKKWVGQGIVLPEGGTYKKNGMLGARPLFDDDVVDRVQAWCWPADPVCQVLYRPWGWHGPAYDCYEDHAAVRLATDLYPWLREQGWDVTEPVEATCPLDTSGR